MHSRYGEREEAGSEKTAYLSPPFSWWLHFPSVLLFQKTSELSLSAAHLVVQPHDHNETAYAHARYRDGSLKNQDLCAVL